MPKVKSREFIMRMFAILSMVWVVGCASTPPTSGPQEVNTTSHRLDGSSLRSELPTLAVSPQLDTAYPDPVEPNGVLGLDEVLALALLYNRQLEAAAWDVRAREAALLQSRLSPNPVLGFKVENFGGSDANRGFDSAVNTLRISQVIELGDKRLKRTRLAQQERALSTWDYEAQRLDVIAQTAQRFIDVLALQRKVELAQQNLALAEELLAIVTDRVDQGLVPGAERDKARVQVNTRRIELDQRQRQLAAQRRVLASQWDSTVATYERVTGDLTILTAPPTYERAVQGIEDSPALARWSAEIALRRAAIDLSDAHVWGDLTVGGGVRQFNATDEQALVFELGIPLPLADRNQGTRRQRRYDLERAVARQRHARTWTRTTLYQKMQILEAEYRATQILLDDSVPSAQAAYDAALEAFAEGVTDYLNVLDAQRTLIATQDDVVETLAAYHKTHIEIESLLGTPLPEGERRAGL